MRNITAHLQNLAPEALVAALSRHSAIRYFSLSSQSWCWISLSTFKVPWGKLNIGRFWRLANLGLGIFCFKIFKLTLLSACCVGGTFGASFEREGFRNPNCPSFPNLRGYWQSSTAVACAFSWTVISWKISTFCSMWFAAPPRMWWWFSRLNCSSVSGVLEKLPLLLPFGKKHFFFWNDELFE